MKCTNKKRWIRCFCALTAAVLTLSGCGKLEYDIPYVVDANVSTYNVVSKQDTKTAVPFASRLCVVSDNVPGASQEHLGDVYAAVLFDLQEKEVLHSQNAHDRVSPASLTKVMTALVALKYGNVNQTLTATNAVTISEKGAQLCGLKPGDVMTLDQALRILLLYSANDVAMLIADSVAGSVDRFVEMMNEEAKMLGATNTNFVNPHGLTDPNHYTTAYDLYLIFNEAIKYETFTEIIQMTSYQTTYYDKDGKEKKFDKNTTNLFVRGDYTAPDNVTVIGGKTGTTSAAGHCLILLSRDVEGSPYISVICGAPSTDELYQGMTDLLEEIHK